MTTTFKKAYGVVDPKLAEEGAWVDLQNGIEIKIVRSKSKRSRKVLRRLQAAFEPMIRTGSQIADAAQDNLVRQWAAEGLLVDWRGPADQKGKAVPFSVEAALEAFKQFDDFLDNVVAFAQQAETFRRTGLEERAGN